MQTKRDILIIGLCAAQIQVETIDELKNTNFYHSDLKVSAKRMVNSYTKRLKPIIEELYRGENETITKEIITGIDEVTKMLCTLEIEQIGKLGAILKALKNNELKIQEVENEAN